MRKPMNIDFERCTSGIEFEEWIMLVISKQKPLFHVDLSKVFMVH